MGIGQQREKLKKKHQARKTGRTPSAPLHQGSGGAPTNPQNKHQPNSPSKPSSLEKSPRGKEEEPAPYPWPTFDVVITVEGWPATEEDIGGQMVVLVTASPNAPPCQLMSPSYSGIALLRLGNLFLVDSQSHQEAARTMLSFLFQMFKLYKATSQWYRLNILLDLNLMYLI